jgi:hypothetical protein
VLDPADGQDPQVKAIIKALEVSIEAFQLLRANGVFVSPNHPQNPERLALHALADALVLRAEVEWQAIETAPKEGRILVYNPYFGVYSSEFTVEREHLGDEDMRLTSDRPIKWEGYPLGLTSTGLGKWYCVATHCRPLPAGPR